MGRDIFLIAMSVFIGSLFIAISVPLNLKRVPPNKWYGLRIPATLSNETVWYDANAWMAKDMLKLGVLVIIAGVVLHFTPIPLWGRVLVWAGIVEGGVIAVLIRSWRYANNLLKMQQQEGKRGQTS